MLNKTAHRLVAIYKKTPTWLIGSLLFAIVMAFIVMYLRGVDFSQLGDIHINWYWMAWASLVALAFRYLMVFIWRDILYSLGSKTLPSFTMMSDIYAKSWLARYIPGTVTWIAGKVVMAANQGVSKSRLVVSSLLEAGMQVTAAVVLSLILIGFSPHIAHIPTLLRVIVVLMSLAFLTLLSPPVFNRLLRLGHSFTKRELPAELRVNRKAMLRSFGLFIIGTFLHGAASFWLIHALVPNLPAGLFLYIVGAFGLSGAIGMATPFLPSGIGVRDGALLVLLAAVFPRDIALAITLVSRLWQVAVDILFFAVAWLHHKTSLPRSM